MLIKSKLVVNLAPSQWPQVGGVETHLGEVSNQLVKAGWQVKILVPPHQRPAGKLGLIWLWFWVLKQSKIFLKADVIQIHDVFLWFLPVWPLVKYWSFINRKKIKIITTFHGWEGTFPLTSWQIFNKQLAQKGSTATIGVGAFIEKFYSIKPNLIVYGGVAKTQAIITSQTSSLWIYLGRLANDTGLPLLLSVINPQHNQLEFWGDGLLFQKCQKIGKVRGWVKNPLEKLSQLQIQPRGIIAGGYLAVLEALSLGLRVMVIADNPLKLAYYQLAPFAKYLIIATSAAEISSGLMVPNHQTLQEQARDIKANYSWENLAMAYIKLYEA